MQHVVFTHADPTCAPTPSPSSQQMGRHEHRHLHRQPLTLTEGLCTAAGAPCTRGHPPGQPATGSTATKRPAVDPEKRREAGSLAPPPRPEEARTSKLLQTSPRSRIQAGQVQRGAGWRVFSLQDYLFQVASGRWTPTVTHFGSASSDVFQGEAFINLHLQTEKGPDKESLPQADGLTGGREGAFPAFLVCGCSFRLAFHVFWGASGAPH